MSLLLAPVKKYSQSNLARTHQQSLLKYIGTAVIGLSFSPDGRAVASVGANRLVRLWDVDTGRNWLQFGGSRATFSPDGQIMASVGRDSRTSLWRLEQGREVRRLEGPKLTGVTFSPNGHTLAGFSDESLRDKVMVWDIHGRQQLRRLEGIDYGARNVVFSPDGRYLAAGGTNVRVWEVESGHLLHRLAGHRDQVEDVAFSPDGQLLASASRDGTVQLWEVQTGAPAQRCQGHTNEIHNVVFSPDGQLVATACWDLTVGLWEVVSGREVARLRGHRGYVQSVAFSPDGGLVASGSWDRTVRVWRLDVADETWQQLEAQWAHQLKEEWRQARRCEKCGERLPLWDRWRGIQACQRHRPNYGQRDKSHSLE